MKIARVVLELSVPRQIWSRRRFRNHILKSEVGQNEEAHFHRVANAVRHASAADARTIVLPAYTLIGGATGTSAGRWRSLPRRFGFEYLLGGELTPERKTLSNAELWREESLFVASKNGPLVPEHQYGPLPVSLGDSPAIAAISSSVINVRRFPEVFRSLTQRATCKSPLLILDMGHNQYGSRYKRRLKNVATAAQQLGAGRTFLLVSSWRWRGSSSGNWALTNQGNTTYDERIQIPTVNGRTDYVDLFTV
jgi:hypothetical protein